MYNSVENSYADGGAIAGSTAKGALSGFAMGASIGGPAAPITGAIGAVIGGATSFFKERKNQKNIDEAKVEADKLALETKQDNYDNNISGARNAAFSETVNSPINPVEAGFAYGGYMGNNEVGEINSTDVTEFNTGGSHETNPNGGIPQGIGPNGKVNKVEAGEVKIKKGKGDAYVFSDRLIYY